MSLATLGIASIAATKVRGLEVKALDTLRKPHFFERLDDSPPRSPGPARRSVHNRCTAARCGRSEKSKSESHNLENSIDKKQSNNYTLSVDLNI